jgi:hypothetical protein
MYNVVTKPILIQELKKSRYYKQSLGLIPTVDKNGERVFNEKDEFNYFYSTRYNTTIYRQGNIGDINFYIDYYIQEDLMAFYLNSEEFIFNFDFNLVKTKGIDFYLGSLIKKIEVDESEKAKEAQEKKIEIKKEANPEKVFVNPGAVTYDDLKAYMAKKNQGRLSTDEN